MVKIRKIVQRQRNPNSRSLNYTDIYIKKLITF